MKSFTKQEIEELINFTFKKSAEKGEWENSSNQDFKDKHFLGFIRMVILANESKDKPPALIYIMADFVRKMFEFAGGYNLKINTIYRSYNNEIEQCSDIKIKNHALLYLTICRLATDIKFKGYMNSSDIIGEILAKLDIFCQQNDIDLGKFVKKAIYDDIH